MTDESLDEALFKIRKLLNSSHDKDMQNNIKEESNTQIIRNIVKLQNHKQYDNE